jgi:branched-chain amino acid transport system substrate-binding protein
MPTRLYLLAALGCALAVVSAASAAGTPGVTSSSILIGGTTPLTGPAQAYQSVAKGADAYFKYVNDHGGVFKRKIKYKYLDDGYNPSQTVQATRQLVQQDKVFAIFNSLGTEPNLAIRDYLNQLHVPQLFCASGATTWGRDYKKYPWTIGYQPSYVAEAAIYGRYIARTKPKARIGVLYQNDDYGNDLLKGLRKGLGKKTKLIVARQGYNVSDPDVRSQVARLKSARVNTFMIFATAKFAIQAFAYKTQLDWYPQTFVNAVSSATNVMQIASTQGTKSTNGATSIIFLKDPTDPRWAADRGMKLYRQIMARYNPRGNVRDIYNVYGMSAAFTLVDALKHAGKNLTRAKIRAAVTHLNEHNDPFVLPGIVVKTTPTQRFPLAQAKLERYANGHWVPFGPLVSVR